MTFEQALPIIIKLKENTAKSGLNKTVIGPALAVAEQALKICIAMQNDIEDGKISEEE